MSLNDNANKPTGGIFPGSIYDPDRQYWGAEFHGNGTNHARDRYVGPSFINSGCEQLDFQGGRPCWGHRQQCEAWDYTGCGTVCSDKELALLHSCKDRCLLGYKMGDREAIVKGQKESLRQTNINMKNNFVRIMENLEKTPKDLSALQKPERDHIQKVAGHLAKLKSVVPNSGKRNTGFRYLMSYKDVLVMNLPHLAEDMDPKVMPTGADIIKRAPPGTNGAATAATVEAYRKALRELYNLEDIALRRNYEDRNKDFWKDHPCNKNIGRNASDSLRALLVLAVAAVALFAAVRDFKMKKISIVTLAYFGLLAYLANPGMFDSLPKQFQTRIDFLKGDRFNEILRCHKIAGESGKRFADSIARMDAGKAGRLQSLLYKIAGYNIGRPYEHQRNLTLDELKEARILGVSEEQIKKLAEMHPADAGYFISCLQKGRGNGTLQVATRTATLNYIYNQGTKEDARKLDDAVAAAAKPEPAKPDAPKPADGAAKG